VRPPPPLTPMSTRYAPLPNPHTDPLLNDDMEAAFEEDDEDTNDEHAESRPPNPSASYASPSPVSRTPHLEYMTLRTSTMPAYHLRALPQSPPQQPFRTAFGNSNDLIPSPSDVWLDEPRSSWFRRATRNVLPNSLAQRFHLDHEPTPTVVGGGTNSDGVFANVAAKPSRPVQFRDGLYPLFYLSHCS
jgi:hypothetical protein